MHIYSVSAFVRAVSDYLEQGLGMVAVQGEVVDFKISKGKLIYFELKDDASRVLCFAIKGSLNIDGLESGQEVKLLGVPKLFKGTGGFHIHVREVELVGEGALQKQFALLQKKLDQEGIFDTQYKQTLPAFPEKIGLITSRDAAAYNDVMIRLNERWGGLTIMHAHVGVQGLGSPSQIVKAIAYFNTHEPVDTLILTRGGGGLEDLQAFNDERVVRAVFASKIPIVVGVGHERDTTLAELAADVRASTPTNAAERVVPHQREVMYQIDQLTQGMAQSLSYTIDDRRRVIDQLIDQTDTWLTRLSERVAQYSALLHSFNPHAVLKRGYSITQHNGKTLSSTTEVKTGDELTTVLSDGEVTSVVS